MSYSHWFILSYFYFGGEKLKLYAARQEGIEEVPFLDQPELRAHPAGVSRQPHSG
jgi:hypothetical protein